jgi:mono/diheme cytochrome c family protein
VTTTTAGATSTTAGATSTTAGVTPTTAASVDGKALYTQYCVSCHQGGLGSITAADQAQVERVIKTGKDSMPGYADKLSAEEITAIFTYLTTLN